VNVIQPKPNTTNLYKFFSLVGAVTVVVKGAVGQALPNFSFFSSFFLFICGAGV
jgi:hypothetical protein